MLATSKKNFNVTRPCLEITSVLGTGFRNGWTNLLKVYLTATTSDRQKCQLWYEIYDQATVMQSFVDMAAVIIYDSHWNSQKEVRKRNEITMYPSILFKNVSRLLCNHVYSVVKRLPSSQNNAFTLVLSKDCFDLFSDDCIACLFNKWFYLVMDPK